MITLFIKKNLHYNRRQYSIITATCSMLCLECWRTIILLRGNTAALVCSLQSWGEWKNTLWLHVLPSWGTLLFNEVTGWQSTTKDHVISLEEIVQNWHNSFSSFQPILADFCDLDMRSLRENRRLIQQFCKPFNTRNVYQITQLLLFTGKWKWRCYFLEGSKAIRWGWCWHLTKHAATGIWQRPWGQPCLLLSL